MAALGFGRGWVRVARVEASRTWYTRSGRWILLVAMLAAAIAAAVPAIAGGLIAQDDVVPPELNLDDPNVVGSLYLAGAGILAVPALLWGMLIGDPRAPRRHAVGRAVPMMDAVTEPAVPVRRGSLADSRRQSAVAAAQHAQRSVERARLRVRAVRISERVSLAADPRATVIARAVVAAGAGLVLGIAMLGTAVLTSVVTLTIFGSSLWLTDDHTMMIGVRMILVSAILTATGAGIGALLHGLRPAVLRPILLTLVALVVVGADVAVRIAQSLGALPESALRFVPSVVVRAACGIFGTGFPPATPYAVSGPRALALLVVLALLAIAAATTRAAVAARHVPETRQTHLEHSVPQSVDS
ncbi:hypothetical protein M2390_002546 [Mycetocola sp. BIGb0189]|uniref:hypothetical protein n=1 Tax=Mycetocola sp. BIGb0189 TaxID=2940604 RepID=UPI00216A7376|nr:hypothetical protein [Mycetocola sp. BIGb0189]MCS4277342.1 hypothetical protein [Mycetocola sp. BIGb0189]